MSYYLLKGVVQLKLVSLLDIKIADHFNYFIT